MQIAYNVLVISTTVSPPSDFRMLTSYAQNAMSENRTQKWLQNNSPDFITEEMWPLS